VIGLTKSRISGVVKEKGTITSYSKKPRIESRELTLNLRYFQVMGGGGLFRLQNVTIIG
jgi:hypothetical protein